MLRNVIRRPQFTSLRISVVITLAHCLALGAGAAPTITAAPLVGGATTNDVRCMSYNGAVVAGVQGIAGANVYRWSAPSAPAILPPLGTWVEYAPVSMNLDGTAIAGTCRESPSPTWVSRWTQAGGWAALGAFGGITATPAAISADGQVISGSMLLILGASRTFRWTPGGGGVTIAPPAAYPESYGAKLSQAGDVIVGGARIGASFAATRWTQPSGNLPIGALPGDPESLALCTNFDGSRIAGWSGNSTCYKGFYYVEGVGFSQIGPVAGFGRIQGDFITPDGGAVCCNMTVACGGAPAATDRAAVYTQSRGVTELQTYLAGEGVNLTGWVLNTITGVSNDGTVLCGNGTYLGAARGWVVRGINPICGPWIFQQPPSNVQVCAGSGTALGLTAFAPTVPGHVVFQWNRQYVGGDGEITRVPLADGLTGSGTLVTGSSSPNMSLSNVQPGDAGMYVCSVTAGCGSIWSFVVNLQVVTGPPVITGSPGTVSKCAFGTATFSAFASSASVAPFTVTWKKAGVPVNLGDPRFAVLTAPNTLSSTLHVSNLKMSDSGAGVTGYTCDFANACAAVPTNPGALTVLPDLDGSGSIGTADLTVVLGNFGQTVTPWTNGDLNGDGVVNTADLTLVLGLFGSSCPP